MSDVMHDIVVVIPVADRPQHLNDCLNSLLELVRRYPYGGKISVLIAEDSLAQESIARHVSIAAEVTRQGIETRHLGKDEQRALVDGLPAELRAQLVGVIGNGESYAHKGASITRNIAYLWLNRLQSDGRRRLFWFIDSDQEFRVNVETENGEEIIYAIDYFRWLDRLFTETPCRILTGKVVGDPPVSPAVMAGNFLDDVAAFLHDMAACPPQMACSFHGVVRHADDAAYHDMAELFGFKPAEVFHYQCPVTGEHDHVRCFLEFAAKLGNFFDGEHPTRRSVYHATDPLESIAQARTIYTGNYVFNAAGLEYFIPFAALKLRMAGPTLGRVIKAELGDTFISANLPMLHKRTVGGMGRSEYRPGIERSQECVDLSGEFERQYFGDVMLFSMEHIMTHRTSDAVLGTGYIAETVAEVDRQMHERYADKHRQVAEKIVKLNHLFSDTDHWWHKIAGLEKARGQFAQFIANMQHNFGDNSNAWQLIADERHRQKRKAAIAEAICRYRQDRAAWRCVLAELKQ